MAQQWYYINDQLEKVGPLSASELKKLAANGTISSTTTLQRNDDSKMLEAGTVSGLFSPAPVAVVPKPALSAALAVDPNDPFAQAAALNAVAPPPVSDPFHFPAFAAQPIADSNPFAFPAAAVAADPFGQHTAADPFGQYAAPQGTAPFPQTAPQFQAQPAYAAPPASAGFDKDLWMKISIGIVSVALLAGVLIIIVAKPFSQRPDDEIVQVLPAATNDDSNSNKNTEQGKDRIADGNAEEKENQDEGSTKSGGSLGMLIIGEGVKSYVSGYMQGKKLAKKHMQDKGAEKIPALPMNLRIAQGTNTIGKWFGPSGKTNDGNDAMDRAPNRKPTGKEPVKNLLPKVFPVWKSGDIKEFAAAQLYSPNLTVQTPKTAGAAENPAAEKKLSADKEEPAGKGGNELSEIEYERLSSKSQWRLTNGKTLKGTIGGWNAAAQKMRFDFLDGNGFHELSPYELVPADSAVLLAFLKHDGIQPGQPVAAGADGGTGMGQVQAYYTWVPGASMPIQLPRMKSSQYPRWLSEQESMFGKKLNEKQKELKTKYEQVLAKKKWMGETLEGTISGYNAGWVHFRQKGGAKIVYHISGCSEAEARGGAGSTYGGVQHLMNGTILSVVQPARVTQDTAVVQEEKEEVPPSVALPVAPPNRTQPVAAAVPVVPKKQFTPEDLSDIKIYYEYNGLLSGPL